MFKKLFISSTSACFELDNELIYYSDKPYKAIVNGETLGQVNNANVFSLFNLMPNTEYVVGPTLSSFTLKIKTDNETACLNVADFGAKGDAITKNTTALQSAINVCPAGGRVYIPKGTYLTGALTLKSNITIELAQGATILGSSERADYPPLPGELTSLTDGEKVQISTWEGLPEACHQPLVAAYYAQNIRIVGEGVLDGNGQNGPWWINHKVYEFARPRLFFVNNCENVAVHGITGCNAASWQFHPFFSRKVGFYDIKINAPKDSPNTDGCNPESCNGVEIIGVKFSVGDDCIAIKSGKMYMGAKYKTPTQNCTIRNCLMQFGHGGVVLGSEQAGGVKDINVTRCYFRQTDRGLRIKTRRGRGKDAVIDGITFRHVKMENVLAPLVINMFYHCDPDGKTEYVRTKQKLEVDERTPYLGKFKFVDIECSDCEQAAGFFYGLPEQKIEQIELENVSFSFKKDAKAGLPAMMCGLEPMSHKGLCFYNVNKVKLTNVVLNGIEGERIISEGVEEIIES